MNTIMAMLQVHTVQLKTQKGNQGLGTSNGIDNGVMWSAGGSAFGTTADLVIDEEVTFKFLV